MVAIATDTFLKYLEEVKVDHNQLDNVCLIRHC